MCAPVFPSKIPCYLVILQDRFMPTTKYENSKEGTRKVCTALQ